MALDLSTVDKPGTPTAFTYTWKDVALYALGIGAKKDELDYVYEGRGPKVIPSFAVVPMFQPMFEMVAKTGGDLAMVVHGAQRVRLHGALAPSGTITTTAKIRGIYDMRKFAVVLIDAEGKDASGKLLFDTTSQIIFRGEGGWGGEPPPKEEKFVELPKGKPADFRIEETTSPEQALLYRLSGDVNPLHADPEFAARVGFTQGPILHGLCTYGYMVRHVAKGACGGDATKITGFEGQFRRPVWPGDTLVTEGWKVAPGKIALQVSVKERNENVMAGCWATVLE
ncbi:putative (R)-specific enoyl-CoA hydratase [Labilithrix luteola]|uniref:Putative (R)-specific enoyl-CoA hydratase n=1 Tax=Labilithrix luteola TaxID=1391654 RepID=A0A0K1PKY7_9BACT|nr:MaoC/PaaZ C-terminal domain-containing protein [Labilithrix luteola]AKU94190.1 putative (R)-specific enoyl-CoA hydratase [Labilithrix luteola]